jgi:hypothetical protein
MRAISSAARGMLRAPLRGAARTRGSGDGAGRWTTPGHEERHKGYLFNRPPLPPGSRASGRTGSCPTTSPPSSPSSFSESGSTPSPTSPSRPGHTRRRSSASSSRSSPPTKRMPSDSRSRAAQVTSNPGLLICFQ